MLGWDSFVVACLFELDCCMLFVWVGSGFWCVVGLGWVVGWGGLSWVLGGGFWYVVGLGLIGLWYVFWLRFVCDILLGLVVVCHAVLSRVMLRQCHRHRVRDCHCYC